VIIVVSLTSALEAQQKGPPLTLCCCHGHSPCPSLCSPMQMGLFIKQRNYNFTALLSLSWCYGDAPSPEFTFKQEQLDFSADWLAKEEDYVIDGNVTEVAIQELMLGGKADELYKLLTSDTSL
jgi:hypothetical protein